MLQRFFTILLGKFGYQSDRKRARIENDDVKEPSIKRRRSEDSYYQSKLFLYSGLNRRMNIPNLPYKSVAKEDAVIDISDDDDDLDVVGVWETARTSQKFPVYKQKQSNKTDDGSDEIKVLKIVKNENDEDSANKFVFQTPSSRVGLPTCRKFSVETKPSFHLQKSTHSRSRDEKKPQLALNESFRAVGEQKYLELVKSCMSKSNSTNNKSMRSPRVPKKRIVDTPLSNIVLNKQKNMFEEVIVENLSKGKNHVEVKKNRELEPQLHRGDSEELQYVGTVRKVNTLEHELKQNACYNDLVDDIKQKYRQKMEALEKLKEEESLKADSCKKRNEKLQLEALGRMTRILSLIEEEIIEEKPELAELTPDMEKVIAGALNPKPREEVLVRGFGLVIKRHDMQTLNATSWLNDEVINFYMELLKERGKLENYPSVHSFSTFFYPTLLRGGHPLLKRWTKKVDIFSFDLVVVPVHLTVHWCMSIIDFRNKTIKYYDSMGSANNDCLQKLLKYLQDESLDKRKIPFDTSGWRKENVRDIPQQMNSFDCGVFSCMFAEYVCRNASISFTQKEMPYFRRKMVYEIFTQKLLM